MRRVSAAAAVGVVVTAIVAFVPSARFAYDNPSLHVALETTEGLIAALLSALALGRLRSTGARRDLALAAAFATLAVSNLVVSAAPSVAFQERPGGFITWLAVVLRLAGASAFLWATVAAPSTVVVDRRLVRRSVAAGAAVLSTSLLAAAAANQWLDPSVVGDLSPAASNRPAFNGHPLLLVAQAVSGGCFAVAAVLLGRRAAATGDELLGWLAAGAALSAAARVNYCLYPSLYSQWVYVGDVLRLGAYLLFLAGAGREISSYWRDREDVAVDAERRRIARELHDGLAQELAFLRSQTAAMAAGTVVPGMAAHLYAAAERALGESRRAIDVLTEPSRGAIDRAVLQAAQEVATRAGATVVLDSQGSPPAVSEAVHRALLRITREATTNALRHGKADTVSLTLARVDGGVALAVADEGAGFDPGRTRAGFGLRSMRERAEALSGTLDVRSEPGAGTTVEVWIPDGR
jgi:signal transduction histidine kinase